MKVVEFESFGQWKTGRVITGYREHLVVFSRNPYGGHNYVLAEETSGGIIRAIRHGNAASLELAAWALPVKQLRKAYAFLAMRRK